MAKTLIPEIYAKIFINCDKKTLNKCRIICKQWNFIINQGIILLCIYFLICFIVILIFLFFITNFIHNS